MPPQLSQNTRRRAGRLLKGFRTKQGLNQAQAAKVLGIFPSDLSNYEAGKDNVSAELLFGLLHQIADPIPSAEGKITDLVRRHPDLQTALTFDLLVAQLADSGRLEWGELSETAREIGVKEGTLRQAVRRRRMESE